MSEVLKYKFSELKLNTKEIFKEIELAELERRKEAAKYASRLMKKNISKKGFSRPGGYPSRFTGTAMKKIGYALDKEDRSAYVGTKSPVAHLLEFGHGDGKTRNKRPFVFPSLREAEPEIIRIMSKPYF